eukprot:m.283025 g.283025  ORF g.283025 m.283025 type:complete len:66 (-) comp11117_c0_seq1:481-678(-)
MASLACTRLGHVIDLSQASKGDTAGAPPEKTRVGPMLASLAIAVCLATGLTYLLLQAKELCSCEH